MAEGGTGPPQEGGYRVTIPLEVVTGKDQCPDYIIRRLFGQLQRDIKLLIDHYKKHLPGIKPCRVSMPKEINCIAVEFIVNKVEKLEYFRDNPKDKSLNKVSDELKWFMTDNNYESVVNLPKDCCFYLHMSKDLFRDLLNEVESDITKGQKQDSLSAYQSLRSPDVHISMPGSETAASGTYLKKFIIHVPAKKGCSIKEVSLNITNKKYKMTKSTFNLYTYEIACPCDLKYNYCVSYAYPYIGKYLERDRHETQEFQCTDQMVYRDKIWNNEAEFQAHLLHIIDGCSHDSDHKRICMNIESVCQRIPNIPDIPSFILNLLKLVKENKMPYFVLAVIIGNVASDQRISDIHLNSSDANNIIAELSGKTLDMFTTSCTKYMPAVCHQLFRNAFSNNVSYVGEAKYFSRFLGIHKFSCIDKYVHQHLQMIKETDSIADFYILYEELVKLYLRENAPASLTYVKQLLENVPVSFAVFVMKKGQAEDICNEDIKQVRDEGFRGSVERAISSAVKSYDIKRMCSCWNELCQYNAAIHKYKCIFENHIMNLLEKLVAEQSETISSLLDETIGLFEDDTSQETLLKSIAECKSQKLLLFFIDLHSRKKFTRIFRNISVNVFFTWIDNAKKCSYGDQFLKMFVEVLKISVERKDVQSQISTYFLNTMSTSSVELVAMWREYSGMFEQHAVAEVFIQHVLEALKRDHQSKPLDIFQTLIGRLANLDVNSRWTAEIVSTLLEKFCSLKSSESDKDLFQAVMQRIDIWEIVVNGKGKFMESVHTGTVYKSAIKYFSNLAQCVLEKRFSYNYCRIIKQHNIKSIRVLNCILHKIKIGMVLDLTTSLEEVEQRYKDEKARLQCVDCVFDRILSHIQLDMLPKHFMDIVLAQQQKLEKLQYVDLSEDGIRELWHGTGKMAEYCLKLDIPTQSQVFWNVYLETDQDQKAHDKPFEPDYNMVNILLGSLLNNGTGAYINSLKEIENGSTLNIARIQVLFKNALDSERLESEKKIANDFLRTSICESAFEALQRLAEIHTLTDNIDALKSAAEAFDLLHENFLHRMQVYDGILHNEDCAMLTLKELRVQLQYLFELKTNLSEETFEILHEIGSSKKLLSFLRDIIDEDIRNLIDAVDDISEQYVQESTVSGLIEVKTFLHPLLTRRFEYADELFEAVNERKEAYGGKAAQIPLKIHACMESLHQLRALYKNVANRGEQTKETIEKILTKGHFTVCLNENTQVVDVRCSCEEGKSLYAETTLVDLRSRALLLMNSERARDDKICSSEHLSMFVLYVDQSLEIKFLVKDLYLSGHKDYENFKMTCNGKDLEDRKVELYKELKHWKEHLSKCREQFFFLNFLQSVQLHTFFEYMKTEERQQQVEMMLKFIHPKFPVSKWKENLSLMAECKESDDLEILGRSLNQSVDEHYFELKRGHVESKTKRNVRETVQKGNLSVVSLDETSVYVVKTVLALYENTTDSLPEPYQVLFCSRDTEWDEIQTLLNRCVYSKRYLKIDLLYCLVSVELLPNEMQFRLVESLRALPTSSQYLLCIIFRGGRNHLFLDEFIEHVTTVLPWSNSTTEKVFTEKYPRTLTLSSEIAGQGKTSQVKMLAGSSRQGVVTLHISGNVMKKELVHQLNQLNLKPYVALHLDIANVDDVISLDTFLFELLFLRYVTTGTESFHLTNERIYLEIANTAKDTLSNLLQTAVCFRRSHLKWENYKDFTVSTEPNSPVQVACAYFDVLERNELDKTDILFTDRHVPLPQARCRSLLAKYIKLDDDLSFVVVNSFLKVLSDQLKKMSCSPFFKTARLKDMAGKSSEIKSNLVKAITNVSSEFAIRSIKSCREGQTRALSPGNTAIIHTGNTSVESMIRWEESNHLIYVFHSQNIQTLSAMYRDVSKVSGNVKSLFERQMKKKLEDFGNMDQNQLQSILQKVSRTNPVVLPPVRLKELAEDYALTPDNLLKMVLIVMRIRAGVPVVVMGETGCGKTSLIRYLANICEVEFDVLNIHAGTELSEIISKLKANNNEAMTCLKKERWVFLDEINTSEHLSLMSDVICHHRLAGQQLSPNLVILSACNPYKLRSTEAICTAGLKAKVRTDELSKLVYRVLPLPQQLVDYVWDFGSLSTQDEKLYIRRMTHDLFLDKPNLREIFVDLLTVSQEFIRTTETSYNVSLRDVQRCRILAKWFSNELKEKKSECSKTHDSDLRAVIMAIAHCYYCRLVSHEKRKTFLQKMAKVFQNRNIMPQSSDKLLHSNGIKKIIIQEQKDILKRMDLPLGTAENQSLQENVFMILVCILNKIPIFVVGKPGCSKSLAMQVIRSNLRGKDSKDEFFRRWPQIYCVSFQGSESSTSDGIIKVFEKAENYQKSNSEDVLSVVILDEIGLAEVSRFNPLKVLHSLLEPEGKLYPNVAVVGISNWALDASKMNRAIHLSRPDMDTEELFETGKSISQSFEHIEAKKRNMLLHAKDKFPKADIENHLRHMAKAYKDYCANLAFVNFHGLRDYYALVKYVAKECTVSKEKPSLKKVIQKGLERNFGGLPTERNRLHESFKECLGTTSKKRPVIDIITENILDSLARHLLLITSGHSAFGILEQKLSDIGRKRHEVIFGSQFEEDLTDDYNYRILSRIILCMEEGIVLILKDLDTIYGSLYDMLNQNYTVIGKTKHCRVALGHYSNPICRVSDTFRCIVLVDESNINYQDPPFLNRFEKQMLRFSDRLTREQYNLITDLEDWITKLANVGDDLFDETDLFPIYNRDLLASLVLKLGTGGSQDNECKLELLKRCKTELIGIMKSDAVIRLQHVSDSIMQLEVDSIRNEYFEKPIHGGLLEFYKWDLGCEKNLLRVIFTFTSVHSKTLRLVKGEEIQTEYIGAFKSEKQLSSRIQHFWFLSSASLLCMQCYVKDDGKHVSLVMSIIERFRAVFMEQYPNRNKHVYLILHMSRMTETSVVSHINFLSNWRLATLDSIDSPKIQLPRLCKETLINTIKDMRPLYEHIKEQLFWSFTRIKYCASGRSIQSIQKVMEKIKSCDQLLQIIAEYLWKTISTSGTNLETDWQVQVAFNRQLLNSSSGMVDALEMFLQNQIKVPLARILFHLETHGVLESFLLDDVDTCSRRMIWKEILLDPHVFDISDVLQESGPECYDCLTPNYSFRTPFFKHMYEIVEETKADFLNIIALLKQRLCLEDIPEELISDVIRAQQPTIVKSFPRICPMYSNLSCDYLDDFCNVLSYSCVGFAHKSRTQIVQHLVQHKANLDFCDFFEVVLKLHSAEWLNPCLFSSKMQILNIYAEVFHLDLSNNLQAYGQMGDNMPDKTLERTFVGEINSQHEPSLVQEKNSLSEEEGKNSKDATEVNPGERSKSEQTTLTLVENVIYENERNQNSETFKKSNDQEFVDTKNEEPPIGKERNPDENDKLEENVVDEKHGESAVEMGDDVDEKNDNYTPSFAQSELVEDKGNEKTSYVNTVNFGELIRELHKQESNSNEDQSTDNLSEISSWKDEEMRLAVDLSNDINIVRDICKNMLPCCATMKLFKNDTYSWSNTTGRILPLLPIVSNEPVELGMLRFCHSITEHLILPLEIEGTALFTLAEVLFQRGEFLHEDVFQCVLSVIEAATGKSKVERQRVIADYMTKCLAYGTSVESLCYLYRLVIQSKLPDKSCSFLKIFVESTIEDQMTEEDKNILQILLHDDGYEDALSLPFYEYMDNCLRELSSQGRLTDPFIILLIDIFEEKYLMHFREGDQDASTIFLTAHNIIQQDTMGVRLIASIGCYKAMLKHAMLECDVKPEFCDTLNTIFTHEHEGTLSQTLPFFNYLRGKLTSHGLNKRVTALKLDLPNLKTEFSQLYLESCLDSSPLILEEAKLLKLSDKRNDERIKMLLEHVTTVDGLLNVYHVLLKEYYIPQTYRVVNDKQKLSAELFATHIEKHNALEHIHRKFMVCLLGRADFKVKAFMHTSESTPRQCLHNIILTFLYSMLLSYQQNDCLSLLQTCICEPIKLRGIFLPGFQHSEDSKLYGLGKKKDLIFTSCACRNRIHLEKSDENATCFVCGQRLDIKLQSPPPGNAEQRKGWQASEKIRKSDFEHASMSLVACNLLFFLLKGCLLGSFALGFSDSNGLKEVLGVKEKKIDIQECLNLKCHWENLLQLLNLEDYQLFILMQSFINENKKMLCSNLNALQSCEDRDEWEKCFSNAVEMITIDRFDRMKQMISQRIDRAAVKLNNFEECIGEFNKLREKRKIALFRMTAAASVENFKAELSFCTSSFPFLRLVIHKESEIKLVSSLYAIIQWHLTVVSATSYFFKRNEILKMSVGDLVYHDRCKKHQSVLKKRFDILCSSWNNICSGRKYDSIKLETQMSKCLIVDENSQLFQGLYFLAGIQNNVIQLAMSMAFTCRSLQVFAKSTKGQVIVPEAKVLEIKEHMLMTLPCSIENTVLQEAQCDHRYGYGRHVLYNFLEIEKSLVRDVLVGKVFIKVDLDLLPKVAFTDELFRSVSLLIQDIRNSITQENLPNDIQNGTRDLHEKNLKMVSQLLIHIGMLLPLLKKTKGDTEETVEEYVIKWKNLLASEFPLDLLPRRNMKLCHIIGLYELLEELNADLVADGLGEEFRVKLAVKEKQYYSNIVEKRFAISENLLKALKKFIHRFLSHRESEIKHKEADTKLPLHNYLSDSSLWPNQFFCQGYVVVGDERCDVASMVPDCVTVGHICDVMSVLKENIQATRQGRVLVERIMENKKPAPIRTLGEKSKRNLKQKRKY